MKKLIIWMAIALIVGHILTEAHSLLRLIWPESTNLDVRWFWSNVDFKINILWWLKIAFDGLFQCVIFFVMAQIARLYSRKLFLIACIYFSYHFFDLVLFFYDYCQTVWLYWSLLFLTTALSIVVALMPIKDGAKFKSLV